jgi:hypothetical protein
MTNLARNVAQLTTASTVYIWNMSRIVVSALSAMLIIGTGNFAGISGRALADNPTLSGKALDFTQPVNDIKTDEDLGRWFTYYYLHPKPDLTPKAILFAEHAGLLDKPSSKAPFVAFFTQLFAHNPDKLHSWIVALAPLSQAHKEFIWTVLWYADTPEAKKQAALLLPQLSAEDRDRNQKYTGKPVAIENWPISSPAVLDMLWSSFSATGDDRYVERIMTVLPWSSPTEHDVSKILIGGAAKWSLTANAVQHKRVLDLCMKDRDTQPQLKTILTEVIEKATKPRQAVQKTEKTKKQ